MEPEDGPVTVEGYDVGECEAWNVDGERLALETPGPEWGEVVTRSTGIVDQARLEEMLRAFVRRHAIAVEETGDFAVDAANAIAANEWNSRSRFARWLSRRLFRGGPIRFER